MELDTANIIQKRKKQRPGLWMKNQLVDFSPREKFMSSEELPVQSEEPVNILLQTLNDDNLRDVQVASAELLYKIQGSVSLSRTGIGYSLRETGTFVFSLKDLYSPIKNNPVWLLK
ncbi:RsbRD N-terminal domain-containing protein [Chitinophaga sp. CF418]|uniref:RsbRD N-terminal domain-containing protein n=1 Tax=Chitinophaga sp. CF418 TaxID=1855287 RepID=UPI00091FCB96|nr:RsbRD N-terminal domain-containing protein [Chitinophaga sp. CF418]SHN20303.1 RsbT co-antagonist protein rsbRD N-terminal domain-containing protein [Chitinophaga sp. CF418]